MVQMDRDATERASFNGGGGGGGGGDGDGGGDGPGEFSPQWRSVRPRPPEVVHMEKDAERFSPRDSRGNRFKQDLGLDAFSEVTGEGGEAQVGVGDAGLPGGDAPSGAWGGLVKGLGGRDDGEADDGDRLLLSPQDFSHSRRKRVSFAGGDWALAAERWTEAGADADAELGAEGEVGGVGGGGGGGGGGAARGTPPASPAREVRGSVDFETQVGRGEDPRYDAIDRSTGGGAPALRANNQARIRARIAKEQRRLESAGEQSPQRSRRAADDVSVGTAASDATAWALVMEEEARLAEAMAQGGGGGGDAGGVLVLSPKRDLTEPRVKGGKLAPRAPPTISRLEAARRAAPPQAEAKEAAEGGGGGGGGSGGDDDLLDGFLAELGDTEAKGSGNATSGTSGGRRGRGPTPANGRARGKGGKGKSKGEQKEAEVVTGGSGGDGGAEDDGGLASAVGKLNLGGGGGGGGGSGAGGAGAGSSKHEPGEGAWYSKWIKP